MKYKIYYLIDGEVAIPVVELSVVKQMENRIKELKTKINTQNSKKENKDG